MAENSFKIKVETETDFQKVKDLRKELDEMKEQKISIKTDADDSQLKNVKKEVDDLNGEKAEIDVDADDSQIKSVRKEVDDLNGEKVQVDVDVDDSQVKAVKKEISDMGDNLSNSLGSTSSAVTGAIAGMAGKSIWDTIYDTSKRAETNKILLKNMADQSVAYDTLYNTIDSTTDQSLISMQQLIPALNGIKAATGSNAQTINEVTPKVAEFGQYVYALSGSSAKAETAMFDLSKGIKGAFASLDQYGITEDALMRTGLWTGKEDDVVGYMNAVEAVTGSTEELMGTTQGLEALMGKAFSRGGKRIGEDLLPMVKQAITGFMQLDTQTDGWLSTMMLVGGGALTAFTTFLSTAGQVINGIKMMKEAYDVLRAAEILEGIAGWFSISWMLVAIAIGIALGLAFIYLYNNSEEFRNAINNLGQTIQFFVTTIFSELLNLFNYIQGLGQQLLASVGITGDGIVNTIVGVILFFSTIPGQLAITFVNILANLLGFKGNFVDYLVKTGSDSVNGFMSYISSLPGRFRAELQKMLGYARDFLVNLPAILKNAAINVVKSWIYGTGEHSPGDMYDAFTGELAAMQEAPNYYGSKLFANVSRMGSKMVSSFKPTGLNNMEIGNTELINLVGRTGTNDNNNSPQGSVTINIYGDVDNDDRMKKIVEAVRRELSWNNKTAGRTIG